MEKIEAVSDYISNWLREYVKESGQRGYVVGVSGGIDSAVTSLLCARSGVPTTCLTMPIHQNRTEYINAKNHIEYLNRTYGSLALEVDLTIVFDVFLDKIKQPFSRQQTSLASANSRSRFRMLTLYHYAALHRYLVAGTGNKIEDFGIGFFTKYGDGGVDVSPIADLYKSEVYELGKILGVSKAILEASPTDGLFEESMTDEQQIGASYSELEWAMKYSDGQIKEDQLTPRQEELLKLYQERHYKNEHKMHFPPVCKIPKELRF